MFLDAADQYAQESEHCKMMREVLDKAASDQKVLLDKLLEMQKLVVIGGCSKLSI